MQYAQTPGMFWDFGCAICTNPRGLETTYPEPNFSIRLLSPVPTLPLIFFSRMKFDFSPNFVYNIIKEKQERAPTT